METRGRERYVACSARAGTHFTGSGRRRELDRPLAFAQASSMSQLAPDLLALLADPETHEGLTLASEGELAALREALRSGQARRRDGKPAAESFEGALLSQGRRVVYLIDAGIPNLLIDERLELASALATP